MKRFISYTSAALAVLFIMLSAVPVQRAAAASSGLSITPRKDLIINPGQTVTDKLNIGNLSGKEDLNVTLRVVDFTFTDESGTPKLLLADNAPTTTWSLKPFMTLPKTVVVPAGKSASVSYSLSVPAAQGAGSYYSAVEYAATGANGGNVSLNASGASLVFVSVPGIVQENMTLKKFGAYQSNPGNITGSFIFIATGKAPQQFAYTLKNDGNVAENPTGSIVVKDMFGHVKKTISNVNVNSALALRGQARLFTACIDSKLETVAFDSTKTPTTSCVDPHLKPGRYTASLDVFYGQNGNTTKEITGTASFWYLPWWFIAAVLAGLLVIISAIWWVVRKVRGRGKSRTRRQ